MHLIIYLRFLLDIAKTFGSWGQHTRQHLLKHEILFSQQLSKKNTEKHKRLVTKLYREQYSTNVNKNEHKVFSWSVALTKKLFRIGYSAFVLYLEKIDGLIRSRK